MHQHVQILFLADHGMHRNLYNSTRDCGKVSSGQSLLTAGSGEFHCQQSLMAVKMLLLATACSEKSLLATASSERSLLLLSTITSVCVHVRACICAEVNMCRSTCKLSTCMPFCNVFTQNLIPLEGKRGHSLLLLPTVTAVYPCVYARACMHAY